MVKDRIHVPKDFPWETLYFLMDCEGHRVISKFVSKMVVDYSDMKYRIENLQMENNLLKSEIKNMPKK